MMFRGVLMALLKHLIPDHISHIFLIAFNQINGTPLEPCLPIAGYYNNYFLLSVFFYQENHLILKWLYLL